MNILLSPTPTINNTIPKNPTQPRKKKNKIKIQSLRPKSNPFSSLQFPQKSQKKTLKISAKMMHMTFYWGRSVTILFDSWTTDSWPSYFLSLFALFLFSLFYQYMDDRRLRLRLLSTKPPPQSAAETPLLFPKLRRRSWAPHQFLGAILFGVNAAIGYFLMLAVMSFNGGVFIAVVAGLAVGYLIFRGGDEDVVLVDNPCACAWSWWTTLRRRRRRFEDYCYTLLVLKSSLLIFLPFFWDRGFKDWILNLCVFHWSCKKKSWKKLNLDGCMMMGCVICLLQKLKNIYILCNDSSYS